MTIDGYQATISYDETIDMFRGEFIGLNGGADFYATDITTLRQEGSISLRVFLDACQARGIEPLKRKRRNVSSGRATAPSRVKQLRT
jgi:predicted HicB family RNase H-like nuclease